MIKSLIINIIFFSLVFSKEDTQTISLSESKILLINNNGTTVNLVRNKNNFTGIFIQLMYCSSYKGKSHIDIYDNTTKFFSTDIIGNRRLILTIPNPKKSKLSFKIFTPYLYIQYKYTNERNFEYPSFITREYFFGIKNHTINYIIKPLLNNKPVTYQIFIAEGIEIKDECKQYEFSLGNNYYDKKNFPYISKNKSENISLEFNYTLKKFKENKSNFTIILKAKEEGNFNTIDFYYVRFEKVDWEKDVLGITKSSSIFFFIIIFSILLFIGIVLIGFNYLEFYKKEENEEFLSEESSKLVDN